MTKNPSIFNKCLLVCWFLLANNVFALLDDSTAVIEIKAQTLVIDERLGKNIYSGNVQITQGSLRLNAENVELFITNNKITKLVAKGSSKQNASYRQKQNNQSDFIEADAAKITYLPQRGLIDLQGDINLVSKSYSFNGYALSYDIKNDTVIAQQSKPDTERVRFKIKL